MNSHNFSPLVDEDCREVKKATLLHQSSILVKLFLDHENLSTLQCNVMDVITEGSILFKYRYQIIESTTCYVHITFVKMYFSRGFIQMQFTLCIFMHTLYYVYINVYLLPRHANKSEINDTKTLKITDERNTIHTIIDISFDVAIFSVNA